MPGTKISIAKFFSFVVVAANLSAAPEHFPLEVGNSWVYRVTQGRVSRPGTIDVQGRETIAGREYYRVNFFEDLVYLRYAENGSLVEYDRELEREQTWVPLGAQVGQPVESSIDPCSKTATIDSRDARVSTLLGEFNNTVHVTYTPNCADAGVVQQYYLPYVGLILHETTTIAGPVQYELVYSRTGLTNIDPRTNAFTIATDSPTYKAGDDAEMLARLSLRVTEPVTLTFPSAQSTDLHIYDEKGEIVYTWSADKLFAQVFRQVQIGPGERSWAMQVPLDRLAPGRYVAQGWLTTDVRRYSAVVTFEIVR